MKVRSNTLPCQSCKSERVKVIEQDDDENYPYRLCKKCHKRLIETTLRPLEYYNLKSLHGLNPLLYDYDEKNGSTIEYDETSDTSGLEFPDFHQSKINLEELINYTIVDWYLQPYILCEFDKFDNSEILDALKKRALQNKGLKFKLYEIAGITLGRDAEEWIRSEWKKYAVGSLSDFSDCLSLCLEPKEGFELYLKKLKKITSPTDLSEEILGLSQFHSSEALLWIENNINRVKDITPEWGELAFESGLDWNAAKKWIKLGKPLSLVSLDALERSVTYVDENFKSKKLDADTLEKKLNLDSILELKTTLQDHLTENNTKRVRDRVNSILEKCS